MWRVTDGVRENVDPSNAMCKAYPAAGKRGPWDRETAPIKNPEAPVWWKGSDGVVDFEDPRSRAWLGGRDIVAYECRG